MPKVECIHRTSRLARALKEDMELEGLTIARVATLAGVGRCSVYSILYPRSRDGVSKERAVRIIETLTPDPAERIRRLILAGIDVYRLKDGSDRFFYML